MAPTPLTKKLRLQPGQRALLLNAPEGYLEVLGELPEGVGMCEQPEGEFDFAGILREPRRARGAKWTASVSQLP